MARPAPVPMKAKFNSQYGIYEIGGKTYTPKWYANALQLPIQDCKEIIERGHREGHKDLPQGILVVGETKWKQIEKSYASWVGLTMFHYYEPNVNPGEIPSWLKGIKEHGTKIFHETKPGEGYYLGYPEADAIYRFFDDSPRPEEMLPGAGVPGTAPTPPTSGPPSTSPLPSGTYKVSGFLTIEE